MKKYVRIHTLMKKCVRIHTLVKKDMRIHSNKPQHDTVRDILLHVF